MTDQKRTQKTDATLYQKSSVNVWWAVTNSAIAKALDFLFQKKALSRIEGKGGSNYKYAEKRTAVRRTASERKKYGTSGMGGKCK